MFYRSEIPINSPPKRAARGWRVAQQATLSGPMNSPTPWTRLQTSLLLASRLLNKDVAVVT